MKVCNQCNVAGKPEDRVQFNHSYKQQPLVYKLLCVHLIYLPLLSIPFIIVNGAFIALYLKMIGVKDYTSYRSFLPDRQSHRYNLKNQVTKGSNNRFNPVSSKLFWILNCTWYCPYSVALFEWHAKLMTMMETLENINENHPKTDGDLKSQANDFLKRASMLFQLGKILVCLILTLCLPFVMFSALITVLHLKMAGATNVKVFRSFLPENKTFSSAKTFWGTTYLRLLVLSIALFNWHAYLVKLVENWWCPFHHNRKEPHYRAGAINQSFWHLYPEDFKKLSPDDRDNPIWNEFK
jgi:hypothetical protein